MADYVAEAVAAIRAQVGDEEVILGLSGGVDSSVAAALIHKAIGDQLTCVFVDHGLLRLERGGAGDGHLRPQSRRARDPRRRRRRDVRGARRRRRSRAEAQDHRPALRRRLPARGGEAAGSAKWLAQGTIYPDVIESAGAKTKKAHTIKSHHNVGGLPETLHLKLLEPLRELFKDEVRELGLALGLPREMVFRHPFPGPGLGVRILGEVTREHADLLRRADAIFIDELRQARDAEGTSWYDLTAQAFAVFLPVRSVGVMGDGRTYEHVVALRAVQTTDFMTAHWAPLPHDLLAQGVEPDHQRGARHQPRRLRHLQQAAGDDRVGVAFEVYRGLSRSIEKSTQCVDSTGECLLRSIGIYRWDALQFDGKSDGRGVALSSRRKFTVRPIPGLTVNSRRRTKHPCGFPGDRQVQLR